MTRSERSRLPIEDVLPKIAAGLATASSLILRAPTGAGKTTRVPPFLLDEVLERGAGKILLVEPRRIAARAAAMRMARERSVPLGGEVGYAVRFDRRAGKSTRILAVTDGLYARQLLNDPFLEGVAAVVFDEFHERGLELDLAFALTRSVQREVRPDLKIVVMSATLDPEPLRAFLEPAVYVESEGRIHPVETRYVVPEAREDVVDAVCRIVRSSLPSLEGDFLVFLPGLHEIRRAQAILERGLDEARIEVFPLHGDLDPRLQERVLERGDRRRIVLATNVAEASLTIPGTRVVVDSLLARVQRYDPASGLNRLVTERISRASAEQRRGRAGREDVGTCIRLIAEREFESLPAETEPEVRRVELSSAALQLHAFGESDPRLFPWFERPREEALEEAERLLERLGALRSGTLTEIGRQLADLPAEPRLGRLLLEGRARGVVRAAATAAALLAERDPFRLEPGERGEWTSDDDVADRVGALSRFRRAGSTEFPFGTLAPTRARWILRTADELARLVRDLEPGGESEHEEHSSPGGELARCLLAAFPDRVAKRREEDPRAGVLVGGRGVRLARSSHVTEGELFVACDLQGSEREARVHLAARVERSWLAEDRLHVEDELRFDEERERVTSRRVLRYEDLVLEEKGTSDASRERVEALLLDKARGEPARALDLEREELRRFFARVDFLRRAYPERSWPSFDEGTWTEILAGIVPGKRSYAELRKVDLVSWLLSSLDREQRRLLEREAPETLTVPSGSKIRLLYEPDRPPVLAVRIQEVFSWTETPRLAEGRIPVLLHLLAPNMRPQQITDDLASFWRNAYVEVRKELKRRYPKHAWPDDPARAEPTRSVRRRT